MAVPAPVLTAYESALPDDPNVVKKQMFGSPCAFVNRQMFFGTFENTLVARVGPARVKTLLDEPGMRVFSPSPGKTWDDYVQLELSVAATDLAALAVEALAWASALPKKGKRPKHKN